MNYLKRVGTATSVAAALLLFAIPTASAQFGSLPKVPGTSSGPSKVQRERANKVNSLAQKGMGKVPSNFRSGAAKKAEALAKAEDFLNQCDALWGPDLAADSAFSGQKRRYDDLKAAVMRAHQELPCLRAYEAIKASFDASEVPAEGALQALDDAAAAYASTATEENARHAKWWVAQAAEMREQAVSLGSRQADRAEKGAAIATFNAQNDALDTLHEGLEAMKTQAATGEAIPAADFDAYEAAIPAVEAFNPTARAYFDDARVSYDLYNAWLEGDAGNAAIAAKLGANVAAAGRSKGKKHKLTIKTKKDHCYLRVQRWINERGTDDVSWQKQTTFSPVQRFWFRDDWRWSWAEPEGFCTTEAMSLTESGKLDFAGTKNGIRYLVLEWSKDDFPMYMAQAIKLGEWDKCDPKRFYSRWANPVPGLLAYEESTPILLGNVDIHLKSRARKGEKVNDDILSSIPPKKVVMRKFNSLGRSCWSPEGSGDKMAVKFGMCERKVYSKYAPKFKAANKAKDRARTLGALKAAEQKIDRLDSARRAEFSGRCEPIRVKIRERMKKENDRLFDLYTDTPHTPKLDVVKHMIAQAEGTKRPLMPDGDIMTRSDHDSRRSRRARVLKEQAKP